MDGVKDGHQRIGAGEQECRFQPGADGCIGMSSARLEPEAALA